MKNFLLLVFVLFPVLVCAKKIEQINHELLNFEQAGGLQPANQLILEGGQKAWAHGCDNGSRVTLNGVYAKEGNYKIKNRHHIIKVDENGKLVESIDHIKNVICMRM